jgi:rare lipoprotein A
MRSLYHSTMMNRSLAILITGILFLFFTPDASGQEVGLASYYHGGLKGYRMANGERYNPEELTCAHPTHPIGSILKVARKDNPDHSVMVVVTDRGPYVKGRIIDLSKRAAKELGIIHVGIAEVAVALIKKPVEPAVVLN